MKGKKNKRIVVAMSGGVDSSVAAALLKEEGYQVIGMTMKIWPKSSCGYDKKRVCCSLQGIADARLVAEKFNIPYYVIDLEKEFRKEVIEYFSRQYIEGRTPNPCIICNEKIKFGHLLDSTRKLNANLIATGHYARVEYNRTAKRFLLLRGRDRSKDQSYVLFGLKQEQLSHTILPIGHLTKARVRSYARKLGLRHVYNKPSSQEICFIPDNNYAKFLVKEIGVKSEEGLIVDVKGNVLGRHKGIPFYTVGQRHGLGIAHTRPLYVVTIDKKKNQIIVGEREYLKNQALIAEDVNWISMEKPSRSIKLKVKIRYAHKAAPAAVEATEGSDVFVKFDKPQEAVTPGQAAVFYKGEVVVGGGWIKEGIK